MWSLLDYLGELTALSSFHKSVLTYLCGMSTKYIECCFWGSEFFRSKFQVLRSSLVLIEAIIILQFDS